MTLHELTQDEFLARDLSAHIRSSVADLPLARRSMITLMISADLAESTAYDLAMSETPGSTASIILAAAELDRHADRQKRRTVGSELA